VTGSENRLRYPNLSWWHFWTASCERERYGGGESAPRCRPPGNERRRSVLAGEKGIDSGSEGMPIPRRHALRPHPGLDGRVFVTLVVSIDRNGSPKCLLRTRVRDRFQET